MVARALSSAGRSRRAASGAADGRGLVRCGGMGRRQTNTRNGIKYQQRVSGRCGQQIHTFWGVMEVGEMKGRGRSAGPGSLPRCERLAVIGQESRWLLGNRWRCQTRRLAPSHNLQHHPSPSSSQTELPALFPNLQPFDLAEPRSTPHTQSTLPIRLISNQV